MGSLACHRQNGFCDVLCQVFKLTSSFECSFLCLKHFIDFVWSQMFLHWSVETSECWCTTCMLSREERLFKCPKNKIDVSSPKSKQTMLSQTTIRQQKSLGVNDQKAAFLKHQKENDPSMHEKVDATEKLSSLT